MMRRDALATIGAAVGAVTVGGCSSHFESSMIHGIYPGDDPSLIAPFERWVSRQFDVTTLFVDVATDQSYRRYVIFEAMAREWDGGRVPMVTWQPFPRDEHPDDQSVNRAIAEGAYDDILDQWTVELAEWLESDSERVLYFRPFPEMNGDWVPWGGDETTIPDFLSAWRRVHDLFDDAGLAGSRVQWIWNPNATEHGEHDTESYYPGDEYVDWVGVDGYNFGESQDWSTWQSPRAVFESMFERVTALSEKPLCVPEFGTSSYRDGEYRPSDKSAWITGVYDHLDVWDVEMACWFNVDKETDWAVFGGVRGTDVYSDAQGSKTYQVYDAFREEVTEESGLAPTADSHLAGDVFRGTR